MRRSWVAVLVIAGILGGCARPRHNLDDFAENTSSTLQVVNRHWGNVDVFLVRDGQRTRVGMVTATSEETFTLAPSLMRGVGTIQLIAHAVGKNGTISSETIATRPGMQISWTLDTDLTRASLAVY